MHGETVKNQYTSLTTCRSVLLIMKNISDNSYRENRNTRFMFNIFSFSKILPFTR